jgi:hypothetical protein
VELDFYNPSGALEFLDGSRSLEGFRIPGLTSDFVKSWGNEVTGRLQLLWMAYGRGWQHFGTYWLWSASEFKVWTPCSRYIEEDVKSNICT